MRIEEAIEAVLAAGRRLGSRGLISGAEGNVSVRLDAERILVTPTGRRKDELFADDLVDVRLAHPAEASLRSPSGRQPTSDLAIHVAVHLARPAIGAVVHAHLPAAMALTAAGEAIDPTTLPETSLHLPRLPVIPFAPMGSADLAAMVADALTARPDPPADVAVLERHGAVAVGVDVVAAVDRLELVEVLCRTTAEALLLRGARAALGRPAIVTAPSAPPRDHDRRER